MLSEIIQLLIPIGVKAALAAYQAATGPDGTVDLDYLRRACVSWEEMEAEILGKKKDG